MYTGVREVIERTKPEVLAIEKLFYQHNQMCIRDRYGYLQRKTIFQNAGEQGINRSSDSFFKQIF